MSASVLLTYTAYVRVTLPIEIAKAMESGELDWCDKWATVYYTDPTTGQDVEIEGETEDTDYKRSESQSFEYEITPIPPIIKQVTKKEVPTQKPDEDAWPDWNGAPTLTISENNIAESGKDAVCNKEEQSDWPVQGEKRTDGQSVC